MRRLPSESDIRPSRTARRSLAVSSIRPARRARARARSDPLDPWWSLAACPRDSRFRQRHRARADVPRGLPLPHGLPDGRIEIEKLSVRKDPLGVPEQLGRAVRLEPRQNRRERPEQRGHRLVHLVARRREIAGRSAAQQPGDEPRELLDPAEDDVALRHRQAP